MMLQYLKPYSETRQIHRMFLYNIISPSCYMSSSRLLFYIDVVDDTVYVVDVFLFKKKCFLLHGCKVSYLVATTIFR